MKTNQKDGIRWARVLVAASLLVVVAVLFAFGSYQISGKLEIDPLGTVSPLGNFLRRIGILPPSFLACAATCPVFVFIAAKREIAWNLRLIGQFLFALLLASVISFSYCRLTASPIVENELFVFAFAFELLLVAPVFAVMIVTINMYELQKLASERVLLASQLQAQLAQSRLETISNRIRPHFLFNTLQCISTLINRDPGSADRAVNRLSSLLRRSLKATNLHFVPIEEELDAIEEYVSIYQLRFGDRLAYASHIAEEAKHAQIPSFCLQPIVENAIEHGLSSSGESQCSVNVSATSKEDMLVVVVENKSNLSPSSKSDQGHGLGLQLTRNQLSQHFGSDYSIDLAVAGKSAALELMIPLRKMAT